MSTMKIITPKGAIREVDKVVPVVEMRVNFNGQKNRFVEAAKNMEMKPTALALHYSDKATPICGIGDAELFVGNLSNKQLLEIQQDLVKEGFFDFSSLKYQKADSIEKTVFDEGKSDPYTSDVTQFFSNFTGVLLGAGFNNLGCMSTPICGFGGSNPFNNNCDGADPSEIWDDADDADTDDDSEEGEY